MPDIKLNQNRLRPLRGMSTGIRESSSVVLVVEDEELLRAFAAWQLEEAGFEVLQAANADEALQAMKSRPDVRVLFTDVQMPGRLDGMDLARKIHEQWPKVSSSPPGTVGLQRPTFPIMDTFSPNPIVLRT